jgi:hypothetical protein
VSELDTHGIQFVGKTIALIGAMLRQIPSANHRAVGSIIEAVGEAFGSSKTRFQKWSRARPAPMPLKWPERVVRNKNRTKGSGVAKIISHRCTRSKMAV